MPEVPVPHIYDVPFPRTHLLHFKVYRDKLCQLVLQYMHQVDRVGGRTEDLPGTHAFVVGLHGPWGSGKSTLMRMVGEKLERKLTRRAEKAAKAGKGGKRRPREPGLRIEFQAWRYSQREELWRAFLSRVVDTAEATLRERLPDAVGRRREIARFERRRQKRKFANLESDEQRELARHLDLCDDIKTALYRDYALSRSGMPGSRWSAVPSLRVDAAPGNLGEIAGGVKEVLHREQVADFHERIRALDGLEGHFRTLRQATGHKWIIEIDDLDRCLPEEAVEIFETTKIFLDAPGVVFLVAIDRETIRRGLRVRYHERAGDRPLVDPDLFVEKVSNVSFALPTLSEPDNVQELIREADPRRVEGLDDPQQIESIERLMAGLLLHQDRHVHPNPRRWIRLLNTALLYSRMRKPLEIDLLRHGFERLRVDEPRLDSYLEKRYEGPGVDEAERDRYRKRAGKPLERCGQRERYRLWAILQAIRHRGSWDDYSDGTKEPPVDAIWGGEDADRTFLKFVCLSYRWGGFMEAVLNSWEVMVTFEQAASQADRNFERFREICAAKYPALSAYAEDPDLFQVLLSRPQVAHPRPPDFITEMF